MTGDRRDELVRSKALELGIPTLDAAFIIAQELGEVDSDEVLVDEDGNVITRDDPDIGSA